MASYLKKEISEWNTKDLTSWLTDNKYPGISELFQNNSLSGYDLFFINDDILKNELGLSSFHERKVTMKLINKLINEHLKLNIINSNGDNVVLTLDNNHNTSLGELSEYIGGMFNMDPKDILYKDFTKKEVLSPTLKIIKLIILYPKLYKTLNVFNMKDYHQMSDENNENNDPNNPSSENDNENENELEYQEMEYANNDMNYYKMNRNNMTSENNKSKMNKFIPNDNRIPYNEQEENKMNMNKMKYSEDYDIKNKQNYRSEKRIYRGVKNENVQKENSEEGESDYENDNRILDSNDLKYRNKTNYRDNNIINKDYYSVRNKKIKNNNDRSYQENYNNRSYKNIENRDNYYNSALN